MESIIRKICRIFPLMLMALAVSGLAAHAQLAPHRAVYDLSLKNAAERSGINNVRGRMVIELTGDACEGWNVEFRMINQYVLQRGETRLADNRSTSWEDGEGNRLRYSQRQYIDNQLQEEILVKADRAPNGNGLVGRMSKPDKKEFELPSDAVFPAQHQRRLVEAALAGESSERSVVYDGSEGTKVYVAASIIGAEQKDVEQGGEGVAPLRDLRAWPVSISYYSLDDAENEGLPVYQVRFRMFENGVAGDLELDYTDFVLTGKLSSFNLLQGGDCTK
jgi:hypothetical protein